MRTRPWDARRDGWEEILRGTSRSFFSTLRLIPSRRRGAVSLAYLIARAGDTLTDAGELEVRERGLGLQALRSSLGGEGALPSLPRPAGLDEAHNELLRRAPELVEALLGLDASTRAPTLRVLRHLLRGMHHELAHLGDGSPIRCETLQQTLAWTWRAAGCVGRYWSELLAAEGVRHPGGARCREREGARLGIGLQLVNLLRDLHEDHHNGRSLLPGLSAAGEADPGALEMWTSCARAHLEEGFRYAGSLPWNRVRDRLAVLLPARLGLATLEELERRRGEWEAGERVKIDRARVARESRKGLFDALIPGRLGRRKSEWGAGGVVARRARQQPERPPATKTSP